eukprot:CAMPEP_0114171264 /NCGR_PEP_ID=MMETSP0043_2-20121206/34600_1 /TAXON_ID=464988 /ORGANISM="Hemiselmis andersenii, Strain CCMP644" /LENGTH=168 /DNA_ID=CAMNT_0001268963 /DNA_START=96 /DNA_END=598 /DNA_ORIENTATION=-
MSWAVSSLIWMSCFLTASSCVPRFLRASVWDRSNSCIPSIRLLASAAGSWGSDALSLLSTRAPVLVDLKMNPTHTFAVSPLTSTSTLTLLQFSIAPFPFKACSTCSQYFPSRIPDQHLPASSICPAQAFCPSVTIISSTARIPTSPPPSSGPGSPHRACTASHGLPSS